MLLKTRHGWISAAALIAALAGSANAQFNSIAMNETVSMSLQALDANGSPGFINSLGHFAVQRNVLTDLGANNFGTGRILGLWNESVLPSANQVTILFRSSNGEDIAPISAVVPGGGAAVFWSWAFGASNPLNFLPGISSNIISASMAYSNDGGSTTFSVPLALGSPWNGTIPGIPQNTVGFGVNFVQLTVFHQPVPTPGALALFGAAGLAAARRRR